MTLVKFQSKLRRLSLLSGNIRLRGPPNSLSSLLTSVSKHPARTIFRTAAICYVLPTVAPRIPLANQPPCLYSRIRAPVVQITQAAFGTGWSGWSISVERVLSALKVIYDSDMRKPSSLTENRSILAITT